MVHILDSDLKDETDLRKFLSDDSDSDLDNIGRNPEKQRLYAEIEPEVAFTTTFPLTLLIAGLPKVPEEKFAKLKESVILRISTELTNQQVIGTDDSATTPGGTDEPFEVELPTTIDDTTKAPVTTGLCFVTFKDTFVADQAAKCLSNIGLSKIHRFRVCRIDNFEDAMSDQQEYKPAAPVGFSREGLRDWLNDPLGREQYAYRCGGQTDIMAHDAIERTVAPSHERFGLSVCWSPMGSYLVTFHKQGIWLRGDNDFKKKMSFTHDGVKHVLFSPNEEYLITWDGSNSRVDNDRAVIVWQTITGRALRTFSTPQFSATGVPTDEGGVWPFFLFSYDSKYLAMRREKDLVVYELPSMTVLEEPTPLTGASNDTKRKRTPLNYPLKCFQWSPSANLISIWVPETGDAPGRLLLVDIPSRTEVASKNVFSVKSAMIHWQQKGEFMALRTIITRKKGKKTKTETTQIEIFRVKEKSVPVDTISIEGSCVKDLFWEKGPIANRFAILTVGESNGVQSIRFYCVPTKGIKRDTELVATLIVPQGIHSVEWSPAGQYFVAASRVPEDTILFGCLNDQNKAEILQKDEHTDLTDVLWDPSGRYVTTAVLVAPHSNSYRYSTNAGFRIYSFLGKEQYKFNNEKCYQFLWRPRPMSLLSPAKIEDVHRKLKEYSKKYDAQDEARRAARKQAQKDESTGKMAFYLEQLNKAKAILKAHEKYPIWSALWEKLDIGMNWVENVQTWDEVIHVTRDAVKKN